MAFCPNCKGEMPTTAVVCPHCGYDFPDTGSPTEVLREGEGFAYSPLANVALMISSIAAALGCGVAILVGIAAVSHGDLFHGLVLAPLGFFLQLGLLVVFLRAAATGWPGPGRRGCGPAGVRG